MTNKTGNPAPQVIIYETEDKVIRVNVRLEDESAWLTNLQLAELFEVSKSTVSEHIKNIFASEELSSDAVVRKFRTTAADGKSYDMSFYNLGCQGQTAKIENSFDWNEQAGRGRRKDGSRGCSEIASFAKGL